MNKVAAKRATIDLVQGISVMILMLASTFGMLIGLAWLGSKHPEILGTVIVGGLVAGILYFLWLDLYHDHLEDLK